MPLFYLRRLAGTQRSESTNRHLAVYLAFVAGATNAGGFLAVHQYTSHMSGIVSAMADSVAIGGFQLAVHGLAALLSFLFGAIITTLLVRWARARALESEYALPLLLEAVMLVLFGLRGSVLTSARVLGIVMLLCFTMGLQNAMITKLSNSVIRTTHVTGMITDAGIALGRIFDIRFRRTPATITEELVSLRLYASIIGLFFIGGVIGALGFKRLGFFFTLPLAAILLLLAAGPVLHDLRRTRG